MNSSLKGDRSPDVSMEMPGWPAKLWKVATLTSSSSRPANSVVEQINRRIQARFGGGLEGPQQLTIVDESRDPEIGPWQPLPWPPRGFPAVVVDFSFIGSGSTTKIKADVHLPYRYGLLMATMIFAPVVLGLLSKSFVGAPVLVIGLVAYVAGRVQAGSALVWEVAQLISGLPA